MDMFNGIQQNHSDLDPDMKRRVEESEQLRSKGNDLFREGEFENAVVDYYLKAMDLTPNDIRLFINSGLCYLSLAKATTNLAERKKLIYKALIYGYGAIPLDNDTVKPLFIFYQGYDLLGYPNATSNVLLQVKRSTDDNGFEDFLRSVEQYHSDKKLKGIVDVPEQKLDSDDLTATLESFFSSNDDFEQLFFLIHISMYCVSYWYANCKSNDPANETFVHEKYLYQTKFIDRLLKKPVFADFYANLSNFKNLSLIQRIFIDVGNTIISDIVFTNSEAVYPDCYLDFMAYLSREVVNQVTLREINQKKIMFANNLIRKFMQILMTIVESEDQREQFFKKLQPLNHVELLLSLPMVYFTVQDPSHCTFIYLGMFRVVFFGLRNTEDLDQHLNEKIPQEKLKGLLTGLASFGIVANRLFTALKDVTLASELESEINHFIRFFHLILMRIILGLKKENKIMAANIPQLWLLLVDSIEKYHSKPSILSELMGTFENLLEPWLYNLDNTSTDAVFSQEPLCSMIISSVAKMFSNIERIKKKGIKPTSTIAVAARLFSVSNKFTAKFCELVSADVFHLIHEGPNFLMAHICQFYWQIFEHVSDEMIERILLKKNDEDLWVMEDFLSMAGAAMYWTNNVTQDQDYKVFHGCLLITTLIEKAEELASKGRSSVKSALIELFQDEDAMPTLKFTLDGFINWAGTRQRGVYNREASSGDYLSHVFSSMTGMDFNVETPSNLNDVLNGHLGNDMSTQFSLRLGASQCFEPNKILTIVNKLLTLWGKFEPRLQKPIKQLRKKYNVQV